MSSAPRDSTSSDDVFEAGSTLLPNQEEPTEDPTGTKTVRERSTGGYNARWDTVRGILRDTIEHNDALRLRDTDHGPTFSPSPGAWSPNAIDDFGAETDAERLSRFSAWFRRVLNVHIVEPLGEESVREGRHYSSNPIRKAYARGLALANSDLRRSSLPDPDTGAKGSENPTDLITRDRHQDALQGTFLQVYNDIERAANETHTETTRALAGGLTAALLGEIPIREFANRLTGRVDAVGQTRTATTAHTRVVQAVNQAIIQRAVGTGVEQVGTHVELTGPHEGLPEGVDPDDVEPDDEPREEWTTAGDQRVCPRCQTLGGQVFRTSDVRRGRSPKPPVHPRCRCRLVLIGSSAS